MGLSHSPRIVTNNLLLNLDFANIKNYIGSGTTATSSVAGLTHTLNNTASGYVNFSNGAITFTRSTTATKHGGNIQTTGTGNLTSQNFMYNDHTWEVWFRIDDRTAGGYDATEGNSILACYAGYHQGFMYDSGAMYYFTWDATGPTLYTAASWTLGASGSQINQGSWYQIVVTKAGNVYTPYINGVQLGTGYTRVVSYWSGTGNLLNLGSTANVAAGVSSYCYYAKNTVSNMKMYNRALSSAEIAQNFDALRGRFGI